MRWTIPFVLLVSLTAAAIAEGQFDNSFFDHLEDPAIAYATHATTDVVGTLNERIQSGDAQLAFSEREGYLPALLKALNVPVESQVVVFSKTSVQSPIINPRNPRAIFFNDSVAVAYVPGGFIEIASQDPQQGALFYVVHQQDSGKPAIVRTGVCLQCHDQYATLGVPGLIVRSIPTGADGRLMPWLGNFVSDHRSPWSERWGGWYVTGKTGGLEHMGNIQIPETVPPPPLKAASAVASLEQAFDTTRYPAASSDVVALMVLEHQTHMMNLLTRIGWEARVVTTQPPAMAAATRDRIDRATIDLVDYMLFVDEAPLTAAVQGGSGFAEGFTARGLRDRRGRSLRDFDLRHRLMRYPCSYMIYTEVFAALPDEAKDRIYRRMWQVLSGGEAGKYARLSLDDRRAVVEILKDTQKGLPAYFDTVIR